MSSHGPPTKRVRGWVMPLLASCLLMAPACTPEPPREVPFMRGAWLAHYGGEVPGGEAAGAALSRLEELGVDSVAVGPVIHMPRVDRPEIVYGQEDERLRSYLGLLRRRGFRVLLLPRVESPGFFKPPFPFRADIAMETPEAWTRFYRAYEAMILHYARLCREEGVDMLSVGLEYRACVNHGPGRWRRMILRIREVYDGLLTYSANWYEELEEVPFWDLLDAIGVGAYFELSETPRSGVRALARAWEPVKRRLQALSRRYNRPVVFTEVGYTGFADAAVRPWNWQDREGRTVDHGHQADCFEALFRTLMPAPWFRGLFVWRLYTGPGGVPAWDYTPQGRPAAGVIRRWYGSGKGSR